MGEENQVSLNAPPLWRKLLRYGLACVIIVAPVAYVLVFVYGSLTSSRPNRKPDNAIYCKEDIGCRETLSGGLHCHDKTKCTGMHCSDEEAAQRAGNICRGRFPWYNGGYPMNSLPWQEDDEFYECLDRKGNGTSYCSQWLVLEDSDQSWQAGTCSCTAVAPNGRQCEKWSCEQIRVKKVTCVEEFPADGPTWVESTLNGSKPTINGAWDNWPHQCLCSSGDVDQGGTLLEDCTPQPLEETKECHCDEFDARDVCTTWQCTETDFAGIAENEIYHASKQDPVTGTVIAWSGSSESISEFEYSECECEEMAVSKLFCQTWTCKERGLAYVYPNLVTSVLYVPFVAILLVLAGRSVRSSNQSGKSIVTCNAGFSVLIFVSGTTYFIWMSGLAILVISLWVAPLLFFAVRLCAVSCSETILLKEDTLMEQEMTESRASGEDEHESEKATRQHVIVDEQTVSQPTESNRVHPSTMAQV